MEIHNLLDIKPSSELREWLMQKHKTEKECWVIVKFGRLTDDKTFWYIDAVEEALCFGWIDSTTKKIADGVTAQKLCPRKPRSNWSELNKEICRRMERMGLMLEELFCRICHLMVSILIRIYCKDCSPIR
ncbi:hypothetical protein O6P32_00730 [Phocaeicola sp. KGMB11183]|uniref:Thymidylate synthase n=1 Tax=Phocaeicola acetigenes TaxID=3016083 RepID=A0ABT4PDX5_9BACT|nr:hypothetical protein [Phocaeicola sp. KGMB11183]MCZ8371238.1 hypothetical protein [Phocaeicola sp. KGMB11183]